MAKRVLIAQGVVLGGLILGILLRELPGVVREVKIWRMTGNQAGSRHPR